MPDANHRDSGDGPPTEPVQFNGLKWFIGMAILAFAVWGVLGLAAPFGLQWLACEFGTSQSERGQIGDQFGMINALFTGLALAGVVVSVMVQRREAKIAKWRFDYDAREAKVRFDDERSARTAEATAATERFKSERADHQLEVTKSLYTARLTTLIEHCRLFREDAHYKLARSLAWACAQKAMKDTQFRKYIAKSHSLVHLAEVEHAEGFFRHERSQVQSEDKGVVLSWGEATHAMDDLISFFAVLSLHIKAVEDLKLDRTDKAHLELVVRQLNIYWDWWGPVVRYIQWIRSEQDKSAGDRSKANSAPDHSAEFDRLDRFMFAGSFSTQLPAAPEAGKTDDDAMKAPYAAEMLRLLNDLNVREITWKDCGPDGKSATVQAAKAQPSLPALTYRSIGIWPEKP